MSISASGPAKSKQSARMGQFKLYMMDSKGQPIYKNSKTQYIYLDNFGRWSVSENWSNMHTGAENIMIVYYCSFGFWHNTYFYRLAMITPMITCLVYIMELVRKNVPVHVAINGYTRMAVNGVPTVPSMFHVVSISFLITMC